MDIGFDSKTRQRELLDFFNGQVNVEGQSSLNGWEGLLVWGDDGRFYQMSYKSVANWTITMFPYDMYGNKEWNGKEWINK